MDESASVATYVPIAVAVITVIGVILAPVLSSRTDGLSRASRMTELATKMDDSPERALLIASRNLVAARWAVRAAAPPIGMSLMPGLAFAVPALLLGASVVSEASAVKGGLVDLAEWPAWVSLVCSGIASFLSGRAVGKRRGWIARQLRSRNIGQSLM